MKFSLVIPTLQRNDELFKLLDTLMIQTYRFFEIIIVDQNENNLLSHIDYKKRFLLERVIVVKPEKKLCASAARNFGAKYAKADFLTFPDDDCWYDKNVLQLVNNILETTKADIVGGGSIDPNFKKSNTIFLNETKFISSSREIPKAGIEYSIFIDRKVFEMFKFDENISPGSKNIYQAGEITDLLFFAFKKQKKIYYSSALIIFHPFKKESIKNLRKEFNYAAGLGYVLQKHNYYLLWIYILIRTIGGFINSLVLLRFEEAIIRIIRFWGRFFGFIKINNFQSVIYIIAVYGFKASEYLEIVKSI